MMTLFKRRNLEDYADSLSLYLPGGELFAARGTKGSTFRLLLRGLAGEIFRANGLLKAYSEEVLPDKTERFLDEWESALGIPDQCFSGEGDLNSRRRDILVKLASLGVQTEQDFIDLAAIFGVTVEITTGTASGIFPMVFPLILFDSPKQARFTVIISFDVELANEFPLVFPIPFGSVENGILECLFKRLRPANVDLIFREV